jgi:pimeloyl-ACP methyl ester carboxylesterase
VRTRSISPQSSAGRRRKRREWEAALAEARPKATEAVRRRTFRGIYESTDGRQGGTLEDRPVVILSHRGARSGKLRKTPVMRIELTHVPRAVAARHANLVHWARMDRGGHFAPAEEPDLVVADLRAFFRPLRAPAGGGLR